MEKRIIGVIISVAGIFMWYMPLLTFTYRNELYYQNGNHIGGLAYLLIVAFIAYGFFSWKNINSLQILSSAVALIIVILFLLQAGEATAWGLIAIGITSFVALIIPLKNTQVFKDFVSSDKSEPAPNTENKSELITSTLKDLD